MSRCRVCKIELTSENWFLSKQKAHSYICKSCHNTYNRKNVAKHLPEIKAKKKRYREQNRERIREGWIEWFRKLKYKALCFVSGTDPPQCANPYGMHEPNCPLLTAIESLSIDYIAGGHKRKNLPFSAPLYSKILKEKKFGEWQVLCMCCQFIKRYKNHEIPSHVVSSTELTANNA